MVVLGIPATTANLGPGFDTLGMALNMYNYISMVETGCNLVIDVTGEDAENVSRTESNLVYKSALKVFQKVGYNPKGLYIKIHNNIPMVRGLGSSASAIVGGIVAANHISGCQLDTDELLLIAAHMEGHPDNVAPALLGGIVISAMLEDEILYRKISPPKSLTTVVAIPQYELSTKKARNALPKKVLLSDAIFNMSRTGLLLMSFLDNDMELLSKVMDDRLHQPYRMSLIPGMENVSKAAKENGAYALALSGAGPSLIAFCEQSFSKKIGRAMKEAFLEVGVKCIIKDLSPVNNGVQILDEKGDAQL